MFERLRDLVIGPHAAPGERSSGLALAVEALVAMALAALLVAQALSYPVTDDLDPDGYVTYGTHLKETWTLMDITRLPGYPLFVAIADSVGPSTMHNDVYWAQFGLYVFWVALLWFAVRRIQGPYVALALLALLAAPAFYTRYSVIMVADFVASIAFTLCIIALLRYATAASPRIALRWLALLAGLFAVTFLLHPSTRLMLALLLACAGLATLVCRGRFGARGEPHRPVRPTLVRLGAAMALLGLVTSGVASVADRGNSHYNVAWLASWMVIVLPPASDTEDDRRIEAMKAAASARLGYPIAHAAPIYYPEFYDLYAGKFPFSGPQYMTLASLDGGPFPDERYGPLWRGRVMAHPGELLRIGGLQIFWRYHIIAKQYVPFLSETRLVTSAYLPETGSPRSTLFRTFGIEVLDVPDTATWEELSGPMWREIARVALFVVVTGVGAVVMFRRYGAPALAVVLTLAGWCVFIGLTLPLEPRYFLVWAPVIYLTQAVGLVTIIGAALRRVSVQGVAPVAATSTGARA